MRGVGRGGGLTVAGGGDQPEESRVLVEHGSLPGSMRPTACGTDWDDPQNVFGRELEDPAVEDGPAGDVLAVVARPRDLSRCVASGLPCRLIHI